VPPTPATTGASSSIWSPRPTACPSPGAWRTRSSREREVCLDLLTIAVEAGLVAPGATVLADKGLAGRDIEQQIAELGVRLLRPDHRDEPTRHGSLGGVRQWIESVFDTLKGQLGLEHHGARTAHDVFTRVAQRLPALVAAVAQLGDQRFRQAQPHRLRPLTRLSFKESII
jgi:hypothetical protein